MAKLRVDKIAAPIVTTINTGSVNFDGTNDELLISDVSDYDLGTNDFTIEGWWYVKNDGTSINYFDFRGNGGDIVGPALIRDSTSDDVFLLVNGSRLIDFVPVTNNVWHHIAVVRHGGTTTIYVDGINRGFASDTNDYVSSDILLGVSASDSNDFEGHVSNFRIVKGKAVYTGEFTPPTKELEVTSETILLCCQSSVSATAAAKIPIGSTITLSGNTAPSEFNPGLLSSTTYTSTNSETTGSVFFDGTTDGLRTPSYSDLSLGTGAFTIECWFWKDDVADFECLVSDGLFDLNNGWRFGASTNEIDFRVNKGSGATLIINTTGDPIAAQTWYHVAVQRDSSGDWSIYINGVNTGASASDSFNFSDSQICIGADGENFPTNSNFHGYISNVRIIKGRALYTEDFPVPNRELEVTPDTVLLACYDGENVFAEKTGKVIAAYGDRLSSPTPTSTDSPIGITTFQPGLTRNVDNIQGPTFQGGTAYTSQNWLTLPKGTTAKRGQTGSRGLHMGGGQNPYTNAIDYITITSMGNSVHFGDLTVARGYTTSFSSRTKGICAGGLITNSNVIDYVNIASTGNAVEFGNLSLARTRPAGCSNSTRGFCIAGRNVPSSPTEGTNLIDYVTMATLGDAVEFGNLTIKRYAGTALSSPTRGIFGGGYLSELATSATNNIEYITLSTLGDAVEFGNLTTKLRKANQAVSNGIRGVFCGGLGSPAAVNNIEYITIASLGNSQDFGDAIVTFPERASMSNSIRGVLSGGINPSPNTAINNMDYITIASAGNSQDFGDLRLPSGESRFGSGCSDSHGGLS